MNKNFEKLLKFISSFECEEEKYLYEGIDKFFNEQLNTDKLIVFSIPRHKKVDTKKSVFKSCRFLWNKKYIDKADSNNEFTNAIKKVLSAPEELEKWSYEDNKYVMHLGKNQWQYFYVYFKTNDESHFGDQFMDYICKFIQNNFIRCYKWREVSKYKSLVYIDDVTGLYNQRKMFKDLKTSIQRYEDLKEKFYVFFIDVDKFKQVNDGHGHLVGTQLLSDLAKLLKNDLRTTDYVYRYGGDEYVAIVTDVDDEIASRVGDRVLRNIKKHVFEVDDMGVKKEFKISVSIGIAGFPDDANSYKEILSLADRMMFEAKESGRGQVCKANGFFEKQKKEAK